MLHLTYWNCYSEEFSWVYREFSGCRWNRAHPGLDLYDSESYWG